MKHKCTDVIFIRMDLAIKRAIQRAADKRRLSMSAYLIQLHMAEERRSKRA